MLAYIFLFKTIRKRGGGGKGSRKKGKGVKKTGVALTQLFLTMHNSRRKFYFQHCIFNFYFLRFLVE